MAAPKLRFKDEQGQNYPAWKAEMLCKCCTINPPSPKLPNTFIYIDLESVKQGRLLAKKIVLAKDAPSRAQRKVILGDVLFQTVRPYQKNNFIVKTPETIPMIASTGYSVLRCNKNNSEYIYHETQTEKFSRNVQDRCTGGAYPAITGKELGKIKIPLPSLPEQQKIADFLSAYDRQIDIQSQRVEAMRTRKKGLLQKIFSREIRFKDDQGKDYPAWKEIKLRSIVHRVTRKNRNLITKRPLTISAELGLIDQEEFFSKKIASDNLSNYYLLHKGEFAFNRSSATGYPFGAIKRLNRYESGAISTLYICFSVDNSDYSDWLQHFFESTYWHKEAYKVCCEGARNHGLLNISVDDFFSMKLYLPTLPEQQKIADFLTAIDTQIEVEEKRLETMKTIKKGLLQQMFI